MPDESGNKTLPLDSPKRPGRRCYSANCFSQSSAFDGEELHVDSTGFPLQRNTGKCRFRSISNP
ncbi:hypothetical protein AUJ14_00055 [Candidatus Micrarchaeota archaeon CG1_02_55_22]|nr:MAG: hypothetical protein AUJ14_00055 [Candidatus Micrarchaeota archaeon CG1_02_55_22]